MGRVGIYHNYKWWLTPYGKSHCEARRDRRKRDAKTCTKTWPQELGVGTGEDNLGAAVAPLGGLLSSFSLSSSSIEDATR